jgi:septum formation protein
MLICGAIGMALFRVAGIVLDSQGRWPEFLFRGLPLELLPPAAPDFGIFRLATGLVVRFNLGLLPGLLAGWMVHRQFFTGRRKKKTDAAGETRTSRLIPGASGSDNHVVPEAGASLILASASPRRAELMRTIGLKFVIRPSRRPEIAVPGESPEDFVLRVSKSKARWAGKWNADQWVVAADTVVVNNGEILGKPKDREDAARMLRGLSGATHRVVTGLTVLPPGGGEPLCDVAETAVTFLELSRTEIARYVACGETDDKAGAYGIQGRAAVFVEHIEGSYSNVVGLPLSLLYRLLLDAGFPEEAFRWDKNTSTEAP